MPTATPVSDQEAERLRVLRDLMVLDTAPEPVFDSIARLASEVCGAPIALMSLVDSERQWFKARVGPLTAEETPRDIAFCSHAIEGDTVFEVTDARLDPRFADNPLVTGEENIRFYAGAPLVLDGGSRIGTLCVLAPQAHSLDPRQTQLLQSLAEIATLALQLRSDLISRSLAARSAYELVLAESAARHRSIVEEQSEMVSLADANGELVYVNPAYTKHVGGGAELVGRNLFDLVDPADHRPLRDVVAAVWHGSDSHAIEVRMPGRDGGERWVAWTHGMQRDARGNALLQSVGRDVTERKRAEQALRASQAFLARTGRVAGVGGWELTLATRLITWSDETRRIHGVGADFVPTLDTALSFYGADGRRAIEQAVDEGVRSGAAWDLELPMVSGSGRELWVRVVGETECEHGVPVRMVGAFQDISERKRLQQQLADNERFVRQITDSLPLRVAYIDRDRRYRFANRAMCKRFGCTPEQVLGRRRRELTGSDEPLLQAHFQQALSGEAQCFDFDETFDGKALRIECRLLPDVGPDQTVRGVYYTGLDITERDASERALRVLTAIFDNTPDYVAQADRRGNITYLNPAARRHQQLAPDAPLDGYGFAQFYTEQTQRRMLDTIIPAVKATGVWVGETAVLAGNGEEAPVSHLVIGHRGADGQIDRYSSVMRDISAEVRAKQQLQRQTDTLHSVIEAMPATIAVIGTDLCYRYVNSSFESAFDRSRADVIGRPVEELLGEAEFARSRCWIDRVLQGETVHFEREHRRGDSAHMDVSYIPLALSDGRIDGYIAVALDVTRHQNEKLRLLQLSRRDALTGLLNRAGFEGQLESHLQSGGGPTMALLYIDLDHFKPVNDSHGHAVGDKVLQLFAQRLPKLVRTTDAVARLGGDEFAVLLFGLLDIQRAELLAAKVVAAAKAPFAVGTLQLSIGASVGVAFGADPALGGRDLLARADAMLYRAKAAGRGCLAAAAVATAG